MNGPFPLAPEFLKNTTDLIKAGYPSAVAMRSKQRDWMIRGLGIGSFRVRF